MLGDLLRRVPEVNNMRYLLHISLIVVLFTGLTQAETPEYWGQSIIVERSTDDPREVDLSDVNQERVLIGDLTVKNKSPAEKGTRGSVMVIEGSQHSDGTFWPTAELQVQKEKGGEWIKVGLSGNERPTSQLQIYTGTMVYGLRINLDPFKAHLGKFRFGRIVLTSGDEALFLLDDLKPPSHEKGK